jgi:hypothetical protein
MCDAVATSKEHVPPKSIFPEARQYRVNLITVPSCELHNSEKSKSDELLRFVLAVVPGTNDLAQDVVTGKVMRSIDHSPKILDTLVPDLQLLKFGEDETGGFTLNEVRFKDSIASIVRGLFFYEKGKKLTKELRVSWGMFFTDNYSSTPFLDILRKGEQMLPLSYIGSNPQVFQYAFDDSKSGNTSLCRLRFYEGHPIYILWDK